MEHWNNFKGITETFLSNIEGVQEFSLMSPEDEGFKEEMESRLIQRAEDYNRFSCNRKDGQTIHHYIKKAKDELSSYLINKDTKEGIYKRVSYDFDSITLRLKLVMNYWQLNHVKHNAKFHHNYFPSIQPIYDFFDWFLTESASFDEEEESVSKLSMKEIALLYQLKGDSINSGNKDEVANKYGHKSGHRLYQYFNKYNNPRQRIGFDVDTDKVKIKNQIERYKNIIPLIEDKKVKSQTQEELDQLGLLLE